MFSFREPTRKSPSPSPRRSRRFSSVGVESPDDSGVEGLTSHETSPKRQPQRRKKISQAGPDDTSEESAAEDAHKANPVTEKANPVTEKANPVTETATPVTENPFSTERGRILFEAIDDLQKFECSKKLEIPQLIVVGGQSSGKSSLLQRLTGIPFPVGAGCCTRFPTRITSKRTPRGTKDCFRITIEPAEVTIRGLEKAPETIRDYICTGETFTAEVFVEAVNEVSSKYIGIRHGKTAESNNFAAEVLKVELSGPNRPYFSILDLPGHFNSTYEVNKQDQAKIEEMIIEYMEKPENTVICVLDASSDLSHQPILELAHDHIEDRGRILGVFTKCDRLRSNLEEAEQAAAIALGNDLKTNLSLAEDDPRLMQDGWFFVRNRNDKDSDHSELEVSEKQLLNTFPWNKVPEERRGCTALKAHLGAILDSKIKSSFPAIRDHIARSLDAKLAEMDLLGEPRESNSARRNYALAVATAYDRRAAMALDRPGISQNPVLELRQEVNRLNKEFDEFMRLKGAKWEFKDYEVDPAERLEELTIKLQPPDESQVTPQVKPQGKPQGDKDRVFDTAFKSCLETLGSDQLLKEIERQLKAFQSNQLPGNINPAIYPAMHRIQVSKWVAISNIHMDRVSNSVSKCMNAILDDVCPPKKGTVRLHNGLKELLNQCFETAGKTAKELYQVQQKQETECELLSTTGDAFAREAYLWRKVRYWEGCLSGLRPGMGNALAVTACFDHAHPSNEKNMVNEVNDVLKVYYKVAMEAFIRSITNTVEGYVSSEDGPIKGGQVRRIHNLSDEHLERIAGEDKSTQNKRFTLKKEIKELESALGIVERAKREVEDLS
ncbi:P-loop containing nucleoside triphosphate hydrolase protein [Dactylonectria macrodidyma]|uniref:P-loop containing nucleoside triphosphate hydrolase protein n=1 Tax=Dactylonectria macrodidyma TaxID=307937 RepID=A0A9P9JJR1_9HYPO|nr:P-loop containing nucleoside triphosphate hydrolase protein [Dactylonectria macrodidyma]